MQRPIIQDPTSSLRNRAKELNQNVITTPAVQTIIRDLKDTLAVSEDGIGIAAPQIGESKRIFIVSEEAKFVGKPHDEKKHWASLVYINPIVTKKSRTRIDGVEGCLSVPGKFGVVTRHEKISIEAINEHGKKVAHGATKFFARVIQHELDHLDGVLFIDKAKRFVEATKDSDEKL